MSDATPRLGLPWLMPAQAQKHVTVNESLGRLDALVQCAVQSRTTPAQPDVPGDGEAWILPAGAAGTDWDGFFQHDIAYHQDGAWRRIAARAGLSAYVVDEGALVMFDGASWVAFTDAIAALDNLQSVGVGTAADAANPFAAKLNAALWTARYAGEGGTGDLRYTLNKEDAANTLSLLFQSGWSARAELGLTGSEDFTVKVSPDGSTWEEAVRVQAADGLTRLSQARIAGDCWIDGSLTFSAADRRLRETSTGVIGIEAPGGVEVYADTNANGAPQSMAFRVRGDADADGESRDIFEVRLGGDVVLRNDAGDEALHWRADLQRLGLGTSDPQAALDVRGALSIEGNLTFANPDFRVTASTLDGSDDSRLALIGGGGLSSSRGAYVLIAGNEESSQGAITLVSGVAGGGIELVAGGSGDVKLRPFGDLILFDSNEERCRLTGGALVMAGAAGGAKGPGAINAKAVYDDNVLLTDLVLDLAEDGSWDPSRYAGHPVAGELCKEWLDPDWFAAFWRRERRLPGMISWSDEDQRPGLGELVTRLTAALELQAVHMARTRAELADLRAQVKTQG